MSFAGLRFLVAFVLAWTGCWSQIDVHVAADVVNPYRGGGAMHLMPLQPLLLGLG